MNTSGHPEWSSGQQQQRQEDPNAGPPEWSLHAQVTISHPKAEPLRTTYVATGIGSGAPKDKWTTTGSNIQFQYSWSNCDKETVTEIVPESGIQKFESWPRSSGISPGAWARKVAEGGCNTTEQNFSTAKAAAPAGTSKAASGSGVSAANAGASASNNKARVIQPYGRRCVSTCTITLCNEGQPMSKYSFSSENLSDLPSTSAGTGTGTAAFNRVVVKDVETQTSPPSRAAKEFTSISVNRDTSNVTVLNNNVVAQRYFRGRESFKSASRGHSPLKPQEFDHSSRGPLRTSAARRAKSSPPVRLQQKSNQPRTVHIDVYCTGSETSTTTDDNESSAGTSSTPQTVYSNTQYKIQHQHHKSLLPQHYGNESNNSGSKKEDEEKLLGMPKPKSPVKPNQTEVLNNCLREAQKRSPLNPTSLIYEDFLTLRKNLSGESCDTGSLLSTTYPSSMDRLSRDSTASSFASAFDQPSEENSSWKESNASRQRLSPESSTKSTSFKYEGRLDEIRRDSLVNQSDLDETLLEGDGVDKSEQWWLQYLFSKFEMKDDESGTNYASMVGSTQKEKDPDSPPSNLLSMKRLSFPSFNLYEEEKVLPPFMECSTNGQSHLDTATKFGTVVRGFRKPGHHIPGPTKNPNCPCDHCRQHFESKESAVADEGKGRSRALSLGQMDAWRAQSVAAKKNNLNISVDSYTEK